LKRSSQSGVEAIMSDIRFSCSACGQHILCDAEAGRPVAKRQLSAHFSPVICGLYSRSLQTHAKFAAENYHRNIPETGDSFAAGIPHWKVNG
jgi:hypothetical protein